MARPRSRGGRLPRAVRPPAVIIGLAIVAALGLSAALADLAPYEPAGQNYDRLLVEPGPEHLMGTDNLGRDILSRVVHGGRISLTVGFLVGVISLAAGVPLGLVAGYRGGWVDRLVSGFTDTLMAFPALLLAIAIAAALGQSLTSAIVAIAIVELPRFHRVTRGQVLSVRGLEFVEAARAVGVPGVGIVLRHILPNSAAPIVVQLSLTVSFAILAEAALSFLGLSVPPPAPAWGTMLNVGRGYLEQAPWMALFPGGAIVLSVLGLNLLGDALRDALDPRMRTAA